MILRFGKPKVIPKCVSYCFLSVRNVALEQQLGWQEMDRQQEEIQKSFEALEAKSMKSTRASAAGAII